MQPLGENQDARTCETAPRQLTTLRTLNDNFARSLDPSSNLQRTELYAACAAPHNTRNILPGKVKQYFISHKEKLFNENAQTWAPAQRIEVRK